MEKDELGNIILRKTDRYVVFEFNSFGLDTIITNITPVEMCFIKKKVEHLAEEYYQKTYLLIS